jgi:hypothetical protein
MEYAKEFSDLSLGFGDYFICQISNILVVHAMK